MRCEKHDMDTTVGPCVYCDRKRLSDAILDIHDVLHAECDGDADVPGEIRKLRADLADARALVGVLRSALEEAQLELEAEAGCTCSPPSKCLTCRGASTLAATPEAAGRYLRDVEAERDTWKKLADQYNREAAETTAQAIAERDDLARRLAEAEEFARECASRLANERHPAEARVASLEGAIREVVPDVGRQSAHVLRAALEVATAPPVSQQDSVPVQHDQQGTGPRERTAEPEPPPSFETWHAREGNCPTGAAGDFGICGGGLMWKTKGGERFAGRSCREVFDLEHAMCDCHEPPAPWKQHVMVPAPEPRDCLATPSGRHTYLSVAQSARCNACGQPRAPARGPRGAPAGR